MNDGKPQMDEKELHHLSQAIGRNLQAGKSKGQNVKWLVLKGWSENAATDFVDKVEWQTGRASSPSVPSAPPAKAAETVRQDTGGQPSKITPPAPGKNNNGHIATQDPKPLASFLLFMLWLSFLVEVAFVFLSLKQLSILGLKAEGIATAAMKKTELLYMAAFVLGSLLIFIITAVSFLKWIYLAAMNSKGLGAKGMKITPGWSVGYYFIPVLSFYKPLQSMKEIWQVSMNPERWRSQKVTQLINWWWVLWLLSGVFGQVMFRILGNSESIQTLKTATQISLFSSLLGIPLCFITMKLVRTITTRQQRLIKLANQESGLAMFSKTARGKRMIARRFAWTMWFGLFWMVGAVIVSVLSYKSAWATPGGGTYYVFYGAVVYGLYEFIKGLTGMMKYRR